MQIDWGEIQNTLTRLEHTQGGFSATHRGIVRLDNGQRVFVKLGKDEDTRRWTHKEIQSYRFLERHNFAHMPQLLSWNKDETALAVTALPADEGWNWHDSWSVERLQATLRVMDQLAALSADQYVHQLFTTDRIDQSKNGWAALEAAPGLQLSLIEKLHAEGHARLADDLQLHHLREQSLRFTFRNDSLVHHDIRADNCAWREATDEIRLVDWTWTQIGDRRIDMAPFLVHVAQAGLDVIQLCPERLDPEALLWMAGFWFKAAVTPMWPGGPKRLRGIQLQSGITALQLYERLR